MNFHSEMKPILSSSCLEKQRVKWRQNFQKTFTSHPSSFYPIFTFLISSHFNLQHRPHPELVKFMPHHAGDPKYVNLTLEQLKTDESFMDDFFATCTYGTGRV